MNQKLNRMLQMLNEQHSAQGDPAARRAFDRQKLSSYKDEIYDMTIDELLRRDFASAIMGLTVLCEIEIESKSTYENALNLLRNRGQLLEMMKQRGLAPDSPYFVEISRALGV